MLLEHFHEDPTTATSDGPCCDVCEVEQPTQDTTAEIELIVQAVRDMSGYGEVKVSLYHSSNVVHLFVRVIV